jgi:hypothetical protein
MTQDEDAEFINANEEAQSAWYRSERFGSKSNILFGPRVQEL